MKSNSRDVFAFSLRGLSTMAPGGLAIVVADSLVKKAGCHSNVEEQRCAQKAQFEHAGDTPQYAG